MKRAAQVFLGIVMIAVLFAWVILRHEEPLSEWASSSNFVGWAFHGFALLSFLGGTALIATAWAHGREDGRDGITGDPETDE
ncbi:hypothetical protein JOF48_002249 [Arthrobacter stackebrandtii]|uniref:Uncharacterized protein n=1 Tax=Arthrobacter stackebrandtii TaxID=272161 RepID=A0ABS4YYB4_9MICC|nr:hypothetical protein [Arthrobacter stackebrandtii]MBP2413450.1 hypothetical protein [Arthrobacter stackebrandtii]